MFNTAHMCLSLDSVYREVLHTADTGNISMLAHTFLLFV